VNPKSPRAKLFSIAALLAIVSMVCIAIAVSNIQPVVSGAVSAFAVLAWAAAGIIFGSLCLVLALIAFLQARAARRTA
jgi:hypothetical protein